MEEWRKIPGFKSHYEVSSHGRVRRLPYHYIGTSKIGRKVPRLLPEKIYQLICKSSKGYTRVNIEYRVWFVHRLVGLAFIPNPENKPQINHKNGDKTDNRAENIEWVTNQENRDHAVAHDLRPIGERCHHKLATEQVREIRRLYSLGELSQRHIAKMFGCMQQTVSKIVRNEARTQG